MPVLSDGEGFYRHIVDLPRKRLRDLLCDPSVADSVFKWLCSVEVACPCCGLKPNRFKEIPREKAVAYLGTGRGAPDLFLTLRDLFHQPLGHPTALKAGDVVAEAERLLEKRQRE